MLTSSKPTILLVDDNQDKLETLSHLLQPFYAVLAANSGESALRVAGLNPKPDLILLDIMMPRLNGYGVMARLRENPLTSDTLIIFVTVLSVFVDEQRSLELGAADYISKLIQAMLVLSGMCIQLEAKQASDGMKIQNAKIEAEIKRRMAENDLTQQVTIRALANLTETRDQETGNHILRTQAYVQKLAQRLQTQPRFMRLLTKHYFELLARSAPLHDVGKVGIPDHILLKSSKLTPDEWTIMKTHARQGSDAMKKAESDIATSLEFLSLTKEIATWHHEKWEGSDYPDGLPDDAISLSARLMALADVFDALISDSIYKPVMPYSQLRDIIVTGRDQHFDPDMADVFLDSFSDSVAIAERHRDPHAKHERSV